MGQEKQYTFPLLSFDKRLMILGCIFALVICVMPQLTQAQNRGLGFRGLVPPGKTKQIKYKVEVAALDLPLVRTKDRKGHFRKVFIGPPHFLEARRFNIQKGQRLVIWAVPMKIEGSEVLVAFKVLDEDTDREILLRNRKGEPIWWGGNNRPDSQQGKKTKGRNK